MKKIAWSVLDQIIVSGGNFGVGIYCAWHMSMADIGLYGYIFSTYMALLTFNLASIYQPAAVFFPTISESSKERYRVGLSAWQSYLAIITSFCALCFVVAMLAIVEINLIQDSVLYISLFLYFLLQQLSDFRRRSAYIFYDASQATGVSALVNLPRLILLFSVQPSTFQDLLWILVLSALLPVVITTIRRPKLDIPHGLTEVKSIHFSDNKWLLATSPLMWAWAYGPMFILGAVVSIELAGLFMLARAMLNIANMAMELLETYSSAELGKAYASDFKSFHKQVLKLSSIGLFCWGVGMVSVILWGESLFRLLYSQPQVELKVVLVILWASYGLIFLYRLNAIVLRTRGATRSVFMGYFMGSLTSCFSTYVLASFYGIVGAALALLLGASLILVAQKFI